MWDSVVHEPSLKTFKWKVYHNLPVKHCAHALTLWNSFGHFGPLTTPHCVSPWCALMPCSRKHKSAGRHLDIFGSRCLIIAEMTVWHLSRPFTFERTQQLLFFQILLTSERFSSFQSPTEWEVFRPSLQTRIPCLFIKMNGENFRFLVLNQDT